MKQKRLKNYLKLGVLLFGIPILIYSCQKDDSISQSEVEGNNSVSKIDFQTFSANVNHNETYNRISNSFDNNPNKISHRNSSEQTTNFSIITESVFVIQKNNISYYTFQLLDSNNQTEIFYNLVLKVNEQQDIVKSEVFKYNPTEQWLLDTSQPFSGGIAISNTNLDISILFSSRMTSLCVTGVDTYWVCGAGNNHEPGHPNCDPENNAVTQFYVHIINGPCPPSDTEEQYFTFDPAEGQNPSTGGGGGNENEDDSPTIPLLSINKKPCQGITNLLGVTEIKNRISNLNTNTTLNLNYEKGFELAINDDGNLSITPNNGTPESTSITIDVTDDGNKIGFIHSHYNGDWMSPLFTLEDIKVLNAMYQWRKYHNKPLKDLTVMVVSPAGVYAVVIKDYTKFEKKANKLHTPRKLKNLGYKYRKNYPKPEDKNLMPFADDIENEVLKQFEKYGLGLFKANDDLSGWNELTLDDNNESTPTPCN